MFVVRHHHTPIVTGPFKTEREARHYSQWIGGKPDVVWLTAPSPGWKNEYDRRQQEKESRHDRPE